MTNLTELEQTADREARHGHRELVERLEAELAGASRVIEMQDRRIVQLRARVAELEEALGQLAHQPAHKDTAMGRRARTLLRKGGSDEV